jgi:hypothetical protein
VRENAWGVPWNILLTAAKSACNPGEGCFCFGAWNRRPACRYIVAPSRPVEYENIIEKLQSFIVKNLPFEEPPFPCRIASAGLYGRS